MSDRRNGSDSLPLLSAQLNSEKFSLLTALGGPLGIVETLLPTLIFVSFYGGIGILSAALAAVFCSAIFLIYRIVSKQGIKYAIFGFILVGIGAIWAYMSGNAGNFFSLGFLINGIYALIFCLSILIKQPIIGVLGAVLIGANKIWKNPEYTCYYRNSQIATVIFISLFLLRLAFELPLYYFGLYVALGIMRIILGPPAFALGAWMVWVLLKEPFHQLKLATNSR